VPLIQHATSGSARRWRVAAPCLLIAAVALAGARAIGDEVPVKQPAELLRKNGSLLPVPLLLKVRGGNVTAHSDTSIAPLNFRPGEIQAIRFQQREPEPEVNGASRLKYFYDPKSKSFEKHKILATISTWNISQESGIQEVTESTARRNELGETVVETTKKNKVVYAPTATLSATFANKQSTSVIVSYELILVTTDGEFLHKEEITLDGDESKDVEIDVPTGGRGIQRAVVSDVYNRLTGK
jgi:hypothetical protein